MELEQLAVDMDADHGSSTLMLALDLLLGAGAERIRRARRVVGAALVLAGLAATGVVIAEHRSSLASQSGPLPSLRSMPATAGAAIPPALVASLGATTSLTRRPFLARTIIVRLDPRTGVVSWITGAPARVLMDPTTGTVLSIHHVEGASSA